jgi:hypothetical protein
MNYINTTIFRQSSGENTQANSALMAYLKNVKKMPQGQIQMFIQMFVGIKSVPLDQLKAQLAMLQVTETPSKQEGELIAEYMDNLGYEPERKRMVAQKLQISLKPKQEKTKAQGLSTAHIIIIVVATLVVLIAVSYFVMMSRKKAVVTETTSQNILSQSRFNRRH